MDNVKDFIWRGAIGGLVGGVASAMFLWLVTESQIRRALAIEEANSSGHGHELFSRAQQVQGGMIAAALYGVFLGLIFAVACAALWNGLPGRSPFGRSIRLAAVGLVAWVIVPGLKYPPNPPGVGDPDTVGQRTAWYLILMVVSLALAFASWKLWRTLSRRGLDGAERFAAVGIFYIGAVAVAYLVLPSNPDPIDMPADLVWQFRLDSLAGNALLWLIMGTVFGFLADRSSRAGAPGLDGRASKAVGA